MDGSKRPSTSVPGSLAAKLAFPWRDGAASSSGWTATGSNLQGGTGTSKSLEALMSRIERERSVAPRGVRPDDRDKGAKERAGGPTSTALEAKVYQRPRDHNPRSFRPPATLQDQMLRGARNQPPPRVVKTLVPSPAAGSRGQDDVSLFKSIQSRHAQPAPSTRAMEKLPESHQLQKAAKGANKTPEKAQKKRSAEGAEEKMPGGNAAKKRRVDEADKTDKTDKLVTGDDNKKNVVAPLLPSPPPDKVARTKQKEEMPTGAAPALIEASRVVIQYTVFRTDRIPVSNNLMGQIIRCESFVDKNEANDCATLAMPSAGPPVTRIEMDYGAQDAERDGMFFGRVTFKDDTIMIVYVEKEAQQFDKIDRQTYGGRSMKPAFRDLVFLPHYDVFAFLRKLPTKQDEGCVVYEYDEADRKTTVNEADDSSNDSSDDHDSQTSDRAQKKSPGYGAVKTARGTQVARPIPVADRKPSLGAHFTPIFEGSFSTVGAANLRAIEAFSRLVQPKQPARMDTLMYYKDVLLPSIKDLEKHLSGERSNFDTVIDAILHSEGCAEISWVPGQQLRYEFEEISVMVVRSHLEGPLDLTGAF